jgi:hypothetical protein
MMGELYDVRSASEHLREDENLQKFNRAVRLDLIKKDAIIEYISRSAIARVIGNPELWRQFSNTEVLTNFWALPPDDQRRMWGPPIDPLEAIEEFDERFISDAELQASPI